MSGAGEVVTVDALGGGGDGVARGTDGGRLFVPLGLPGERWRVRPDRRVEGGRLALPLELLAGGPERAEPPCPHFGACGGCRLQHLPPGAYAAFKRERVRAALASRGLGDAPVGEVRTAPLRSRRRLRLALVEGRAGEVRLGYRRRGGNALVAVAVCPIALPELEALLGPLAAGLTRALTGRPRPAELALTATRAGVDAALLGAAREPTLDERMDLAALAEELDLARLAWAGADGAPQPLAERRPPTALMGGVEVGLPAGAFLQATAFGEAELAAAALEWAGEARAVADLYAGLGALGLPLAAGGAWLHAVEVQPAAVAALARASARAGLAVTAEARDLARRPLGAAELARFDAVLLDPPRAGAPAQARELAASRVPAVVYASCDPGTFARDARTLVDGGYRLLEVRPVDQFLFSAEVELVARLARDVAPARA